MTVQIQNILFATDLSENSRFAFRYASAVAARFGGRVILLHIVEPLPSTVQDGLDRLVGSGTIKKIQESNQETVRNILIAKKMDDHNTRIALVEFYGVGADNTIVTDDNLEIVIRHGEIDDEILQAASEFDCNLIVLGSHKRFLGGTAIRGSTKDVLQRSIVPVLVVPPAEAG